MECVASKTVVHSLQASMAQLDDSLTTACPPATAANRLLAKTRLARMASRAKTLSIYSAISNILLHLDQDNTRILTLPQLTNLMKTIESMKLHSCINFSILLFR